MIGTQRLNELLFIDEGIPHNKSSYFNHIAIATSVSFCKYDWHCIIQQLSNIDTIHHRRRIADFSEAKKKGRLCNHIE